MVTNTNERPIGILVAICISTVVFLLLVVIFAAYSSARIMDKLTDFDCAPMTDAHGPDGDNQVVHGKWASRGEE